MQVLTLYCCTHLEDIERVARLVKSIEQHNQDNIPFYISCPDKDLHSFEQRLEGTTLNLSLIPETQIIELIPSVSKEKIYDIRGGLRQQIIKSNYWRLGFSMNYLCLDSDCIFIRNFGFKDFIIDNDTPYSVIHEGKSVLQPTNYLTKKNHREYFYSDRKPIQQRIQRPGVTYDFGYAPFLWSSLVWKSLEDNFLIPNKKSFLDIITENGSEFTWYGEALMKYRAIPLYPREELFKHYHYFDQHLIERLIGQNKEKISKDYMGIVMQSSWEKGSDSSSLRKNILSRLARRIRLALQSMLIRAQVISRCVFK